MPQASILQHRIRCNRILAKTLQLARAENHYTQDALAERMQTDRSYISRIECGYNVPNFATIMLWAQATGIPAHKIIKRVARLIAQEEQQTDSCR